MIWIVVLFKCRKVNLFGWHQSFSVGQLIPLFFYIFWHLPWVSKPGLIPSCACFVAYMQWIPQIHLWYGTCWPVDDSHATLDLCTCTCTSIGGAWVQEWVCHCLTVCDKTHALLNELCWLGKLKLKYSLHITSLGGSFTRPIRSTNILKSIRKDSNGTWDNGAHL